MDRASFGAHPAEVGRILDIGRGRGPVIGLTIRGLDRLPFFVAFEHIGVFLQEGLARYGLLDQIRDFLRRGPDVFQIDGLAILGGADRILRDVDIHIACDGIGHDQRRACQIVGAHIGADPALEVAVARQDRDCNQIIVVDRLRDFRLQRAGVADAGCATIAD